MYTVVAILDHKVALIDTRKVAHNKCGIKISPQTFYSHMFYVKDKYLHIMTGPY